MAKTNKICRVLLLFYRLLNGAKINKIAFNEEHQISERSIERDIEDIRLFLLEFAPYYELIFNKIENFYYLKGNQERSLSRIEVLALLKILMSSRAFRKDEMIGLVTSLRSCLTFDEKNEAAEILKNELQHYISPEHDKAILKMHSDLNMCILNRKKIQLKYIKGTGKYIERLISPLSVVFSEFYFYLIAFIEGENYKYPAFFRLDRIHSFVVKNEKYDKSLYEKYNVGEMKHCLQFMYAGECTKILLKCEIDAVEAIKDRLPNHRIIRKTEKFVWLEAKLFGDGFIRWVLSQGNKVEVLEPAELRNKIIQEIKNMTKLYES